MSLTNKSTLINDAQLIRYAEQEGFNTAERVGKLFVDFISNVDATLTQEIASRQSADNVLQQQLTTTTSVANSAQSTANSANTKATNAFNLITLLEQSIGAAGGIVPLDNLGKIPAVHLPSFMDDVLIVPVNMAGLPAISVPVGTNSEGMPIGLHIIGNSFEEAKIYQLASFIEKELNLNLEVRGENND